VRIKVSEMLLRGHSGYQPFRNSGESGAFGSWWLVCPIPGSSWAASFRGQP